MVDTLRISFIEAYYNFKGHKIMFQNNTLDNLLMKSIEINGQSKIMDILEHHNYLLYYPHILLELKICRANKKFIC